MEQIWANLENPSWWFTGLFFLAVGVLIPKVFFWVSKVIKSKFGVVIPKLIKRFSIWNQKRVLLKVKKFRQHDMKITWLVGRYWATFLLSIIYFGFVTVMFALSQNVNIFGSGLTIDHYLVLLPGYLLTTFNAFHKKTLSKIMLANSRWKRITRRSSRIHNAWHS